MTHVKAKGWTSRRVAVVAGAVPATIGASVLYTSVFDGSAPRSTRGPRVLVGHLVWVCVDAPASGHAVRERSWSASA